jgi:hypothetical protein
MMKKKQTQYQRILNYLLTGKSLTQLQALNMFGCLRLGAIVFNIRKEYYVKTDRIRNKTNGGSHGKYTMEFVK